MPERKFKAKRDDSYDEKNLFMLTAYKIIEKGESNGSADFLNNI